MRNEKTILFVVAVLTVLGVYAYTTIPAGIFPTMSFARIDVVANAGNLPPEQIRVAVALPLERAFQGLPSVLRVLTTSSQGNAEFVVEFDPKSNVQTDLTYVDQAISQVRSSLPPQADVQANIINPNSEPIASYALQSSGISQTLLAELAQQSMVPQFYGVPGLARVSVAGGAQREFHVNLNPSALAQYGLTADDVNQALTQATTVTALGLQNLHYQRNIVVLDANIRSAADIERVTVPTAQKGAVPVSALGTVTLATEPLANQVSFDAHHAVILSFYALPGSDAVKMADAIAQRARRLAGALPAGTHLTKFWDQTTLVKESQISLRDAILLGALLAILVIYMFLRNVRMTLVAAIVIPIAMSIAIFVIGRAGQTLNLMSVGGLAIAVGLIIDDAIVVIENIARLHHQNPGMPMRDTVALAMDQIGSAMVASTTTTVVVFVPLALLSGVSGFFFRALALTLASALIVSLMLALFLAPVLAKWLVRPADQDEEERGLVSAALAKYEPLLRWALAHRPQMYAASGGVLVVTLFLLSRLPSDFLPKLDEGQFEITYVMPVGTTLAATDAAATRMEQIIKADPAVESVGRWTGIDTNGFSPTPQNAGAIRVRLRPANQRAGYEKVSDRLREQLADAVPAAQYDFHQILEDMINDVSGAPAPLEISVRGPDQSKLVSLANDLADRIGKVAGVTDVFSGVVYTDPTIRVSPELRRLAALGWQTGSLGNAIAAQAQGSVATDVPGPYTMIPVRVAIGSDAPNLDNAHVVTPSGVASLQSIASVQPAGLATTVFEENGQRMIRMTGTITGGLSSVIAGVQKQLRAAGIPPGYTTSIGGEYQEQQQSFKEFAAVIAIAVALVFAVMLAAFKSYRLPLVILTAIPLALIGVALGLFVTGTPFNVSSFMGLLLLVGIVVKNGILLVDVANRRRIAGDGVVDALVTAGRTRLRPIVMTTFAAIGGLLPLALGIGSGAAMERPLAIAVIGGLSTATAFTLLVIPVLYAGIAGKRQVV
ncbi:MAG TPA: efflux RND transporter permease subunit [Candidatus Baltobacteraceae bacterium]|nr:efflux RND transporter permease subunit [Candidatus Baltobacteraceae bacterium]